MPDETVTLERPNSAASVGVEWRRHTTGLPENALIVAFPRQRDDAWQQIFADLRGMFSLRDDWDGLDGRAPSAALVASALDIAQIYRASGAKPPSRVAATVNGTIIFEWQADRAYTEVEITRPHYAEGMRKVPGRRTAHWLWEPQDFQEMAKLGAAS
jgi:hypothetical protein